MSLINQPKTATLRRKGERPAFVISAPQVDVVDATEVVVDYPVVTEAAEEIIAQPEETVPDAVIPQESVFIPDAIIAEVPVHPFKRAMKKLWPKD